MSDETRIVTVDGLAQALADSNVWEAAAKAETTDTIAAAIFAALPVATAGPEPDGEKAILDRVRRLAERADPDHVDAVVSFTRQNLAALRGAAAQADGGEPPVDVGRLTRALAEIRDGAYDQNDECQWCGWDYGEGHGPDCPAEAAARALTDPLFTPDPNP